jgi:(p)ppGpp synthase/HD superfamily hydrolase
MRALPALGEPNGPSDVVEMNARTDETLVPLPAGPALYSERFISALVAAARMHRTEDRKGTGVPYISHLIGACAIALEYGANEDQAIAALLHDAIEDIQPTDEARTAVAAFGPEVFRIVEACTDADTHPKPAWRERKVAYMARLATEERAALLVSASDKLHNARAIVGDLHRHGPALWGRFNADSDQPWYYRTLVTTFRSNPEHDPALIDELDRTVMEIERFADEAVR